MTDPYARPEPSPTKSAAEIMASRMPQAPRGGRKRHPNRERIALIEELMLFMGETGDFVYLNLRIKYWLGRTRPFTDSWIRDTMKVCAGKKNPPAFFNWTLKNDLLAIKNTPA